MAVKIVNSTISGNASTATAGAMVAFGNVALELANSTVSHNLAAGTRTGGIAMSLGATSPVSGSNTARPTLKLVSSIVANNSSTGGDIAAATSAIGPFTVSAANSLIYNLCPSPNCTIIVSGPPGNVVGLDPFLLGRCFPMAARRARGRWRVAARRSTPAATRWGSPLINAAQASRAAWARLPDMGAFESTTP